MLLLTRKQGNGILIGDNIKIYFVKQKGSQITIGIEAPKETKILRMELLEEKLNRAFFEGLD